VDDDCLLLTNSGADLKQADNWQLGVSCAADKPISQTCKAPIEYRLGNSRSRSMAERPYKTLKFSHMPKVRVLAMGNGNLGKRM